MFVVAIPAFAIIGLLFDSYNKYSFGAQEINRAWFWLNLFSLICTLWALSALFTIWQIVEPMLLPFVKLQNTCIHIVLGPMVFQELIIGLLAESGTIGKLFGLDTEALSAVYLLNLIILIESVLVGYLFTRAFSASRFYEEEIADQKWLREHDAVTAVHSGELGHHFNQGHKKPRFSVFSKSRRSITHDRTSVQFTDPSAMEDLAGRARRESTVNDHSRFTVRSHTKATPQATADAGAGAGEGAGAGAGAGADEAKPGPAQV